MEAANDSAPERPAWFDEKLEAYIPGLRSLARRIEPRAPEDLVQQTIVGALEHWQSFRPEGGFWTWLQLRMRGARQNNYKREANRPAHAKIEAAHHVGVPGGQHEAVELKETVSRMSGRGGEMLWRHAHGYTYTEIAAVSGVTRSRAQQIVTAERERLAEAA